MSEWVGGCVCVVVVCAHTRSHYRQICANRREFARSIEGTSGFTSIEAIVK